MCSSELATFVYVCCSRPNFACVRFSDGFTYYLILRLHPKYLNKYGYIYVTNIYMTPNCTSSVLPVFVDEFIDFSVTAFNGSFSLVCGNLNLCGCSLLSSLDHRNITDFPASSVPIQIYFFIIDV